MSDNMSDNMSDSIVRQLDSTITKPIDDFIGEVEKVVENFKKRLHNENESAIINITDK